jgi:signal transduction histidine kinase/ligand-binding sensor domain-containing protein/CheY-like chemotaxis protein
MAKAVQIERKTVLLFCVLLAATLGGALDSSRPVEKYIYKSWTSADGLPENVVIAIAQTHDGYLWFGTGEGLARFNGRQFTVFDRSNTPEIKSNDAHVLLADGTDDGLWIGTATGGLTHYGRGRFRTYTRNDGLPDNNVTALASNNRGTLWIGTLKGLAVLRSGAIERTHAIPELSQGAITALAVAPDGLWVIAERRVFKLSEDGKTKQIELEVPSASALFLDSSGVLWLGTAGQGLYRFADGKLSRRYAPQLTASQITTIQGDASGGLWVGLSGAGLCRVGAKVECYTEEAGLIGEVVLAILQDREGSLWAGTIAGVNRLTHPKFTSFHRTQKPGKKIVFTVYQEKSGPIWAGTVGGLIKLEGERVKFYSSGAKLNPGNVHAVAGDGAGTVWAGTESGLKVLRDGSLLPFGAKLGLANASIRSLYYDSSGSLWIAQSPSGLFRLRNNRLTTITTKDGIADTIVRSIMEDREGSLWFTTASGFSRLQNGKFSNYEIPSSLDRSSGGAVCIYEDSGGVLWIGSGSSGLTRFRNGESTFIPMPEGLSGGIWSIVEDDSGYLWMSSNRGLFRVPRKDLNDFAPGKAANFNFVSYGTVDGIPSVEFDGNGPIAGLKSPDGKLYFANFQGIVMADPGRMVTNHLPPPIKLESAMSSAQRISSGDAVVGKSDLQFQFAALSFVAPEHISYRYKLEGRDENWSYSRTGSASYEGLAPRKYRFRVEAANNDGFWNSEGVSFDIVLKPDFYKTPGFVVLCFVSCILGGLGFNALRVYRLKATERRLLTLVHERTVDLLAAKNEAEAGARAKSEFLANMSHEIRTPLNGVLGTLQLVRETPLTDEQFGFLNTVDQSATALLSLINDVLDFSKIEAGKMELMSEAFDPAETIAGVVQGMAPGAHEKSIELCYRIDPQMPLRAVGDSARLKQVLLNLIGNAIKFTEEGEVVVDAEAKEAAGGIELHVCVTDTGIGIAPEHRQMIFESFRQADASHTRRHGGTGLGLSISSRLVALMGGRLWVESEQGKGSAFHFTVLLKPAPADGADAPRRESPSFKGTSVLILDEHAVNRSILQELLRSWEMDAVTFDTAQAALAYLEDHLCDVILTTAEAKGTNYVEHLRANAGPDRLRSTIVMLSSKTYYYQSARCRQMGAAACLIKPVQQSKLADAIGGILFSDRQTRLMEESAVTSPVAKQASLKILLAEDNVVNQKLAVRLLEKRGHKVSVAQNGKEALEQLNGRNFDLVLMDVQMPEMDGLTATRMIRLQEHESGKHLPIIAITAHAMKGDRERCLDAGMDDYLSKPINAAELYETIYQVVSSLTPTSPASDLR